jgi:hypothetical protein
MKQDLNTPGGRLIGNWFVANAIVTTEQSAP